MDMGGDFGQKRTLGTGQPPASAMREWVSSKGGLCWPSVFGLQYAVSAQGILRRLCVLCLRGAVPFMPALRPCRVNVGIEPKGEVRVV